MYTDTIIFTVPHSGTQFTRQLFDEFGFTRWNVNKERIRVITETAPFYYMQHTGRWLGQQIPDYEQKLQELKVITTVRHPHKVLRSFLRRGRTFKENIRAWKSLFEWLPRTDHYIFDIGCRENERLSQMLGILTHIGANTPKYRKITARYVDNWRPLNVTDGSRIKNHNIHIDDSMLKQLDFAVEWYESLPTNDFGDK